MNNTLSNFIESELPYREHTGFDREPLRQEFLRRFDKFFDENPFAPPANPSDWEFLFDEETTVPIRNEIAPVNAGFIDWVNFTFGIEYLSERPFGEHPPEDLIKKLSDDLEFVFGYGITAPREWGLNFYKKSYVLGNDWGFVCVGSRFNQNNTIMVVITGDGCQAAREGWEQELCIWSQKLPRFKLTRVDVAHDDFEGNYNVNKAVKDFDEGRFSMGGRMPMIQQVGDWRNLMNTDGRTVYIGKRRNGKLCRIYEKGRAEGDPNSKWNRIECEWHSKDRIIPIDILLTPGQYLAGAYPAFFFLNEEQKRIVTKKKAHDIAYDRFVEIARRQYGKLIHYMTTVEHSYEDVIDKLSIPAIPKRLIIPNFADSITPIHGYDFRY